MSWNVSIFFDAGNPLDEVIRQLEELWLIKFREIQVDSSTLYRFEGLGLLIDIYGDHGFEDDRDILFTRYPYCIFLEIVVRVREREQYGRSMALFFAQQLHHRFHWPCMVVEDVQMKLLVLPEEGAGERH